MSRQLNLRVQNNGLSWWMVGNESIQVNFPPDFWKRQKPDVLRDDPREKLRAPLSVVRSIVWC